jgi:hypothetical protein
LQLFRQPSMERFSMKTADIGRYGTQYGTTFEQRTAEKRFEDLYGLDDGSRVWECVHQAHEPSSSPYRSLVRAVSQPFFAQMVVPYRPKSAVFIEKRSMDGWRNVCNCLKMTGSERTGCPPANLTISAIVDRRGRAIGYRVDTTKRLVYM